MDELESAEREFKKALKFNRKLPEAYNGLGLCFFQRKRAKQWAIENFKKAIRLDPKYVEARFNLGLTYFDLELDKEAFGQFEKVVQLDPQHPKAYFYLGMIDKRNTFLHRVILDPKRAERAIEAFSKHIEISPQDFQAYLEAA
ncbi:MAG: tetratricopeptide repeat protein, partial [bacterium]